MLKKYWYKVVKNIIFVGMFLGVVGNLYAAQENETLQRLGQQVAVGEILDDSGESSEEEQFSAEIEFTFSKKHQDRSQKLSQNGKRNYGQRFKFGAKKNVSPWEIGQEFRSKVSWGEYRGKIPIVCLMAPPSLPRAFEQDENSGVLQVKSLSKSRPLVERSLNVGQSTKPVLQPRLGTKIKTVRSGARDKLNVIAKSARFDDPMPVRSSTCIKKPKFSIQARPPWR